MEDLLTSKQYAVLKYVFAHVLDAGHAPTYRQICEHFKYASSRAAAKHIAAAKRVGFLTTHKNGIELDLDKCWDLFGIRLFGKVPAGVASLQNVVHRATLRPSDFFPIGEGYYALEVIGSSMYDEGIREGDIVIIDETLEPENNDIVVASPRDDEDYTLKQLIKDGTDLYLRPANEAYETVKLNGGRILAVVTDVHRKYRKRRS